MFRLRGFRYAFGFQGQRRNFVGLPPSVPAPSPTPTPSPSPAPTPSPTTTQILAVTGLANVETRPLRTVIRLNRPDTIYLAGDDQAQVEFTTGPNVSEIHMRWMNDGTKSYDTPDDFNRDGTYDIRLAIRHADGSEEEFPIPVVLGDLDTEPNDFEFEDTLDAELGATIQPPPAFTVSGLAEGYAAPVSATHSYTKTGSPGLATVVNGDTLRWANPINAANTYATDSPDREMTVGPFTRRWRVRTKANPALPAWVPSSSQAPAGHGGFSDTQITFLARPFGAGHRLVAVLAEAGRVTGAATVGGVAATKIAEVANASFHTSLWLAPSDAVGDEDVVVTSTANFGRVLILTGTVLRVSGVVTDVAVREGGYHFSPPHATTDALSVPTGNLGIVIAMTVEGLETPFVFGAGLTPATPSLPDRATATTTGTLTPSVENSGGFTLIAASFAPAV